jgi:hypothetical protein
MNKKYLLISILIGLLSAGFVSAITYPTTLDNVVTGGIIYPEYVSTLQEKLGVDNSTVATSVDYLIKSANSKLGSIYNISTTTGTIIYSNGSKWIGLGIGSAGQVLKVSGGVPIWSTDLSGGGSGGSWATSTDLVYTTDYVVVNDVSTSTKWAEFEVVGDALFTNATTTNLHVSGFLDYNGFLSTSSAVTNYVSTTTLSNNYYSTSSISTNYLSTSSASTNYVSTTTLTNNYYSSTTIANNYISSSTISTASTTAWDLTSGWRVSSSSNYDTAYGKVTASSSKWDLAYGYGLITNSSSSNWTLAYQYGLNFNGSSTVFASTSAYVTASSSKWDLAYGAVLASSSGWSLAYNRVNASSSNWDTAYGRVTASSSNWDLGYGFRVTGTSTAGVNVVSNQIGLSARLVDLAGISMEKGNLIVGNGSNFVAFGTSTNGKVLTASSTATNGIEWRTSAAGVTDHALLSNLEYSVSGHTGFLSTSSAVTNYVSSTTLANNYYGTTTITNNYMASSTASTTKWDIAEGKVTASSTNWDLGYGFRITGTSTAGVNVVSNQVGLSARLVDVAGLAVTTGNLIMGNGSNFVLLATGTEGKILMASGTAGVSWERMTAAGNVYLSTTTAFTAGYISYATSGSAVSNSSIFQSSASLIGFGTTTPDTMLDVWGTTTARGLIVGKTSNNYIFPEATSSTDSILWLNAGGRLRWLNLPNNYISTTSATTNYIASSTLATSSVNVNFVNATTTANKNLALWKPGRAVTITEISCLTEGTSITLQLGETAFSSLATSSKIANLVCDSDSASTTTFVDAAIAANGGVLTTVVGVSSAVSAYLTIIFSQLIHN